MNKFGRVVGRKPFLSLKIMAPHLGFLKLHPNKSQDSWSKTGENKPLILAFKRGGGGVIIWYFAIIESTVNSSLYQSI